MTSIDPGHESAMAAPLMTRREAATQGHGNGTDAADGHQEHFAHRAHGIAVASSLTVFALGFLLAFATYYRRVIDPAAVARRFAFVHRLLLNKYCIDDFYLAWVVRPFLGFSAFVAGFDKWVVDGLVNLSGYVTRALSWLIGKHDHHVVDGLVNAVADAAMDLGKGLSRMHTGRIGNYLMGAVIGVACLAGLVFVVVSRL